MDKTARYQFGVVTIAASGTVTVNPLLSDEMFTNACIACTPLGAGPNYRHKVDLYLDGVVKEENDYATAGVKEAAHLVFHDELFPPNIGLATKAGMKGASPPGLTGFSLVILNYENESRDFLIYSTFEAFSGSVPKRLDFST